MGEMKMRAIWIGFVLTIGIGFATSACGPSAEAKTSASGSAPQKIADDSGPPIDATAVQDKSADTPKMRSDNQRMSAKVFQALMAAGMDTRGLEVVSNFYIVHLRGTVASEGVKSQIEDVTKQAVSSDFTVSNELKVSY